MQGQARGRIDVVVVDDQPVVREALPGLLSGSDIDVRAVAPAGDEGHEAVKRHRPLVALVGVGPRDRRGFELARKLARGANGTRVLLHVRDTTAPATIARARRFGVAGAVSTRSPLGDLEDAIRAVAQGEKWFRSNETSARRTGDLSTRELRVLAEVAVGHSLEEIGDRLHLSPHTVRTHLRNVMRKLDAQTRAHAVAIALAEGAIDVEP